MRSGLRAMLDEKSASSKSPDFSSSMEISEAPVLSELDDWPVRPDVVVMTLDGVLPADWQRQISQQDGHLAVLFLADDPQLVIELAATPVRAWGLLSPDCSPEELIAAVQALHAGLLVGTPALLGPGFNRQLATDRRSSIADVTEALEPLTQREVEVLQLLALGLSNKQIAARLNISEHTVKFHSSSIYAKLGVASRTEAVRCGVQQGIISL
jgi:DNA-binding NarL/FixJ family response regulator